VVESIGGLQGAIRRTEANAAALDRIVEERPWLGHLAADPATRSKTRRLPDRRALTKPASSDGGAPRERSAAFDVAGYRDARRAFASGAAPTVDTADIEALGPGSTGLTNTPSPVAGRVDSP
jgi:phosphoserine aminotransferase